MANARRPNPWATADEALEALEQAGSKTKLARVHGADWRLLTRWLDDHGITSDAGPGHASASGRFTKEGIASKLTTLLTESGIDLDEVERIDSVRVNGWDGFSKGPDGAPLITPLEAAQVVFTPKQPDGPAWPPVQPCPPQIVRPARRRKGSTKWKTAVYLPDPQIGYRRDLLTAELDPFHDEAAIDVAFQIIERVQPDRIVNGGDGLDLAQAGRFVQEPTFALTMQPTIDYAGNYLARQRAAAPDALIDWLEGNHEARLPRWIMENGGFAMGLTRARIKAMSLDRYPVLSVPNLLRFEELGVNYVAGYPAGIVYLNERIACVHGAKVRSGGSTAAAVIDDERVSIVFGHIHRIERQHKTVRVRGGSRSRLAASPGCLSRVDGAVPSTKGAVDLYGRPVPTAENWQQGVAVVTYREGDAPFSVELVPIHEGFALFRGEAISAEPQEVAA